MRALLFDLDGTLIDSAEANYSAYARALHEVGAVVEPSEVARRAAGRQWREFLPELLPSVLQPSVLQLLHPGFLMLMQRPYSEVLQVHVV